MKRWMPAGILAALVVLTGLWLLTAALDPGDFTGQWYSGGNAREYTFQEGLVSCQEQAYLAMEGQPVSGAYCFAQGKVAVFAQGVEGLDTVKELYLVRRRDGDVLCEKKNGKGRIFFYRNAEAAKMETK